MAETHPYTDSNIRCLKCISVVMEVFPKILQKVMNGSILSASQLHNQIQQDSYFRGKLNKTDHQVIQTLPTDGFTKLDITLIFKIITYYNLLIPAPTRGWNSNPVPTEITIGDDAQRLRQIRNKVIHKVKMELTDDKFEKFFSEVISICERVDGFLQSTEEESFKRKIETFKTRPLMKPEEVQRLYDEERPAEYFIVETGNKSFDVYKAKPLNGLIQQIKDSPGESQNTIPITLNFQEICQPEFIKIMNDLREEINQDLVHIKVERIREGSVLVDIMVPTAILLNDENLKEELTIFLRRLSTISVWEENLKTIDMVTMVMSECEAYHDEDQYENMCGDDTMYSPGSLQIDLQVKRSVLQSEEMLQTQLETLFVTIVSKSNGNQIFPSDRPIVSVVEPGIKGVSQIGFSDQHHMDQTESTPSASPGKCESTKEATEKYQAQVKSEKYQAQVHKKRMAIHLQMQQQIKLESEYGTDYVGLCTLPSGLMMFIHMMSSSLIVIKPDGKIKSFIKLDYMAYSITSINENCVAVSHYESKDIYIINVNTEQSVKTIRTERYPRGIAFNDGHILYCVESIGIMRLDIENDTDNKVYMDSTVSVATMIAALNDRVCYSTGYFASNTTITVLDSKYNVLFKYSDENMLASVKDITLDPNGYIYAIGYYPNSQVVIYPDGNTCHKLLTGDSGQRKLVRVHYDPSSEHLIVLYGGGTVCKYSIQMK